MPEPLAQGFPLFPLGIVALPRERSAGIFEDRYLRLIEHCLNAGGGTDGGAFGIMWLSEDELKPVGCACAIEQVLDVWRTAGSTSSPAACVPFAYSSDGTTFSFPAGAIEFLADMEEEGWRGRPCGARALPTSWSGRQPTGRWSRRSSSRWVPTRWRPRSSSTRGAKQELLELRSENARMRLLAVMLEAAIERLDLIERAQARARSNGKVQVFRISRPAGASFSAAAIGHLGRNSGRARELAGVGWRETTRHDESPRRAIEPGRRHGGLRFLKHA